MAQKISSLNEFAVKLNTAGKGFATELEKAIRKATYKVEVDAVKKFGTYQPAVGPFQAWAALNSAYVRRKIKAGSPSDDPLIGHYSNTGQYKGSDRGKGYGTHLRASIKSEVHGLTGVVGTNDEIGKYHEFGTHRIPARPFLRPALYQNREWIKQACHDAITRALSKH